MRNSIMSVQYRQSGYYGGLVRQKGSWSEDTPKGESIGTSETKILGNEMIQPKHSWNPKRPTQLTTSCITPSIMYKASSFNNKNFQIGGVAGAMARRNGNGGMREMQPMPDKTIEPIKPTNASGVTGSAPDILPEGVKIEEGRSVSDVLGQAAGYAGTVAGATRNVPILGGAALGTTAALLAAQGVAKLGEGDYSGAIKTGQMAYTSGAGAVLTLKKDLQIVNNWLQESNIPITITEANIEQGLRIAQASENTEMINRLNRIINSKVTQTNQAQNTQTVNGTVTKDFKKTIVANSGTSTTVADTVDAFTTPQEQDIFYDAEEGVETRSVSTQVRNIPEIIKVLEDQIDILVDQVGVTEEQRQRALNNTVRYLNILGLDTNAVETAFNRGEMDHVEELIAQAVEDAKRPIINPAVDITDLMSGDKAYTPPKETLINQAKKAAKGGIDKRVANLRGSPRLIGKKTKRRKADFNTRGLNLDTPLPRSFRSREFGSQFGESFVDTPGNIPNQGFGRAVIRMVNGKVKTQTPGGAAYIRRSNRLNPMNLDQL